MSFNIKALRDELVADPLAVGYSGMSDAVAATSLNDTTTGRTLPLDTLSAAVLYEAIDTAEFDALSAAQRTAIDRILGLGDDVILTPSSKARAVLLNAFGAGTTTRASLVAVVIRTVSRATELGLPRIKAGNVQEARS